MFGQEGSLGMRSHMKNSRSPKHPKGPTGEGLNNQHTHRSQSSSLWGLPYRILNMNPNKELLWGLRVSPKPLDLKLRLKPLTLNPSPFTPKSLSIEPLRLPEASQAARVLSHKCSPFLSEELKSQPNFR